MLISSIAASGSGYAGTAYAAYAAYTKSAEASRTAPPMEYLSMPHTHTATLHLVPQVSDTLVSNLRRPLVTLIEDTAANHDTVIAACDPQRYRELGVSKWEEHGSCAENLVLALKELNEKAGLKGNRAVGTDVTVNTVPAPLNLFMNIPWHGDEGTLDFEPPKGKKGEFVRLRAERDIVVVMSACPMDVTPVNGGKCMAAHFIVQEPEGATLQKKKAASTPSRPAPKKLASSQKKVPQVAKGSSAPAVKPPGKTDSPAARRQSQPNGASSPAPKAQPAPKAGRAKPKKLERRTPSGISQNSSAKV